MNRFLIGQYGRFSCDKFKRDFRDGFYGIEACLLGSDEDIEVLMKEARERKFEIGVHFPLRSGRSDLRDALILSPDPSTREQAYAQIEQELLDYAEKVKPAYILFHYPKPVILDDRVDWTAWRFTDAREYLYASEYSFEQFKAASEAFFAWISAQGERYGFTPVLELDAVPPYIYETDVLERLLEAYPQIKLCLDTGRLYLQEKTDPYFDACRLIQKLVRYAWSIHL